MLSESVLHKEQNHLFPDVKISGLGNCLREVCIPVDTSRESISRFCFDTEEHRQVFQDTVVLSVLESKLLAANDTPFHLKQLAVSLPDLVGS